MAKESYIGDNNSVAANVTGGYVGIEDIARRIRKAYLGDLQGLAKIVFEQYHINYVSLGDSIAAGHMIDTDWESQYGVRSQYGENGNKETVIVPLSYTGVIQHELNSIYGERHVSVKSFAHSGDTVADLLVKLSQDAVIKAIEEADLVTVCIGANDVLQPALDHMGDYINTGSFETIEVDVKANLAVLDDDTAETSFTSLFNRLNAINPNARYLFTTIYNPYKYLHLEEGRHGFWQPVLDIIPPMVIDVDKIIEDMFFGGEEITYFNILTGRWEPIELDFDVSVLIKEALLQTPAVQTLFDRVNIVGAWTEIYVEGSNAYDGLNRVLRKKIEAFQATNPNFAYAETKGLFDLFPDKTDSRSDVDYGDLVNVEFTRNMDTMKMDWGELYQGNVTGYWSNLAWKYLSFNNAFPSFNVNDYVSFDINGMAAELVQNVVDRVILPDIDPHPEYRGHQVMKRSFTNMLGLVKYNSNGGTYVQDEFVLYGNKPTGTVPTKENSEFVGWFMDAGLENPLNPNSTDYTDYNANLKLSDLASGSAIIPKMVRITTLHAKWNYVIVLQLGSSEGAKFYIETEDGIFSIDNAVDLEGELSDGKFIIDLI